MFDLTTWKRSCWNFLLFDWLRIRVKNRCVESTLQNSFLECLFLILSVFCSVLSLYFSKYFFGFTEMVMTLALSRLSISYSPTCILITLFCTLNCCQKSSDKSNLLNIFEAIITSNNIFLLSYHSLHNLGYRWKQSITKYYPCQLDFGTLYIFQCDTCCKSLEQHGLESKKGQSCRKRSFEVKFLQTAFYLS